MIGSIFAQVIKDKLKDLTKQTQSSLPAYHPFIIYRPETFLPEFVIELTEEPLAYSLFTKCSDFK